MVGIVAPTTTTHKSPRIRPFLPSVQAGQLLLDLAITQYLTIGQIVRLYHSPASLRFVQKRVRRFIDEGYCQELFLQRYTRAGSPPLLVTLAQKGRDYAEAHGLDVPTRYRPEEEEHRNPIYLKHAVAVSDVYVSLKLVGRTHPQLALVEFRHERFLHSLGKVKVNGRERFVIPDAVARLSEHAETGTFLHPLTLELDMGTEKQAKWREKIDGLLAWASSPLYHAVFGTDAIRIAVLTPDDEVRAKTLCAWTETRLQEKQMRDAGAWFRFTGLDAASTEPLALWTEPHWFTPFEPSPTPLLDLEVSDG